MPQDAELDVKRALQKRGTVAKFAREQVGDQDLARLRPGQWLNDEIINFYGALILARSDARKSQSNGALANGNGHADKGKGKVLDCHYFNSFFWTKMVNEGYEKSRLNKWTKKFDIFAKDVVLIPVNHHNTHWTGAAINFREKRIESYDSMGAKNKIVFEVLREYLDAEHRDKKKKPFDFTRWQDHAPVTTPRQENGYDCGVFTCRFLEMLSRGQDFNFSQRDIPYLRRRMIWEIIHGELRDDASDIAAANVT
ncbi:hypothetical protein K488DRAFT_76942 [Vararia minispora EC-137]|uniref:Uncharacterized protein n=1 Tax=Vararia minispora EC-137 TaxID=1314806 RepID=A0ACB8QSS1_9AGAM|nr:hypothetical protein K488DRAFT_76942 [Vararia minispora EC-137]